MSYRCLGCNHLFDEPLPEYLEIDDISIDTCPKCLGEQFVAIEEEPNEDYFVNLARKVV